MKVKLNNVRLAFPALFEPKAVGDSTEKRFSSAFVIPPKSIEAKALADATEFVAKEKWGAKAAGILADLKKKERVAYKESPLSKDGSVYDGFDGMHSLNASNKARPLVLDRDKSQLTEKDGRPYAGCYVAATVELWAQDNQFGKRINATLKGVQFFKDGDSFGGGAPASPDDFEEITEGADAEELV